MAPMQPVLAGPYPTIPELMQSWAKQYRDRPALWRWVDARFEPVTYLQLQAAVTTIAGRLTDRGVVRGAHVAIRGADRFVWGLNYLGALWAGAVVLPIDPLLTVNEVKGILADGEAQFLIADDIELFRSLAGMTRIVSLSSIWPRLEDLSVSGTMPPPTVSPDDLAVIIYTSGTTGTSKGVMLTHANISSDIAAISAMQLLYSDDLLLSVLPIHHAYECTAGFLYPLSIGAQVAYARSLKSNEIIADLRAMRATVILGVPLLFEKMMLAIERRIRERGRAGRSIVGALKGVSRLARRFGLRGAGRPLFRPLRRKGGLDSLRLLASGGAALTPEVAEFFDTLGIRLLQGYGLTEAAPVLTFNRPKSYRYETVGLPLPGVEVRIDHPDPDGNGEIAVRGPMVMRGYWKRPAETDAVLSDGWLLTGDDGALDSDGHVRIVGRSKNVIVTGAGKNIHPEEVESVLDAQPEILESLVYAHKRPGRAGEVVAAIIVPDHEWLAGEDESRQLTESEIADCIGAAVKRSAEHLASYKRVVEWTVRMEPFERTSTRKIRRHLTLGELSRADQLTS
ncbi:MAG TPA: AMP-binding protein [candidate division Zixibacteria bacterium]|jgi:long-chain acyl-CoA synthetase